MGWNNPIVPWSTLERQLSGQIVRDPITVWISLFMPLVMLFLFGVALSFDVENAPLVIVDHDKSPASRTLSARFLNTRYFRFAGAPDWRKRALAALINARARVGVPYGDQGLFATRAAYEAAGGFADAPLFEEVPLVRGLRRQGRFVALGESIGVSPRRWERDGWLRRTLANRALALAYMAGAAPERLARRYGAGGGTPPC